MRAPKLRPTLIFGLALVGAATAFAAPTPPTAPSRTRIEDALEKIAKAAGDPQASSRDLLVKWAIEGPSARVRARAADGLAGRADRDEAVGSLLWRWSNAGGSREIARRAAEALGRIPTSRSGRALWIRRDADDESVALTIRTSWLAVAEGPISFATIEGMARTEASPLLRALAARALARIGGDAAPAALLGAAASERSPLVRDAIVAALLTLPRDRVEADFQARLAGAQREVRTHLLEVAVAWHASASPVLSKAVGDALATRVPGPVAAALRATPYSPETLVAARDRLEVADPVVRDAAVASFVRQLEGRPEDALRFARDPKLPARARIALVASLERIPSEAARDTLIALAREPIVRDADLDLVATAVGALRRNKAPGVKDALASLGDASSQVGMLVASLERTQNSSSQPRAFVVRGRLDRVEEMLAAIGWQVTSLSSASEIPTIAPTPEDAIFFDGPGEMETHALTAIRRFLHLGGSVVLGAGLENATWRDLVPDALERTPANLRPGGGPALTDYVVHTAEGVDPSIAAALEPEPLVMVVPHPVPLRTSAARPLLWSSEMEVANDGVGCVAAEVRVGCGRILALGAVMALRGSESAEGWFNRVRLERVPGTLFPNDEAERRRVAFDWFGIAPSRIAALGDLGWFLGREPAAGMADLPAARFLDAWLRSR